MIAFTEKAAILYSSLIKRCPTRLEEPLLKRKKLINANHKQLPEQFMLFIGNIVDEHLAAL